MNLLASFLFLIFVSTANAEQWVCFDATTKYVSKAVEGDGFKLGLCGINNTNIIPTCILATEEEYTIARQANKKYDSSVVAGSRIVSLTQAEIDAIAAAQQQAAATAETNRINSLDDLISAVQDSDMTITKIDTAIDNITNLAGAKAFLKKLVRAIIILEKNNGF